MKTYNVYWAPTTEDYVKCETVQAKQRRSAEKIVRAMYGQDIIIESIDVACDSYTMELIAMNID